LLKTTVQTPMPKPVRPALSTGVVDAVVGKLPDMDPADVDDVIFGCVSQVGTQAANLGRNVVLASSVLPLSVPGTTVDRQCGSSQQAIHFAAQAVMSGTQDIVIAGGAESMTTVPMMSNIPKELGFPNSAECQSKRARLAALANASLWDNATAAASFADAYADLPSPTVGEPFDPTPWEDAATQLIYLSRGAPASLGVPAARGHGQARRRSARRGRRARPAAERRPGVRAADLQVRELGTCSLGTARLCV
jgi:hypothetical protein